MDSRRDFLKKFGMLSAALGITAVAANGIGDPVASGEVDHETFMDIMSKPKNAASLESTSTRIGAKVMDLPGPPPYKFGFTGFRTATEQARINKDSGPWSRRDLHPFKFKDAELKDDKVDAALHALKAITQKIDSKHMDWQSCAWNTETTPQSLQRAQEAINKITALRLDNESMKLMNPITVPRDELNVSLKQTRAYEMDPYDWGSVFKLTWKDFKADDPQRDTLTGGFEAQVRPHYRVVFGGREIFRSQVIVSRHLLVDAKANTKRLLQHHKDAAYDKIVRELKRVIGNVKRETMALTGPAKFVSNLHISNRTLFSLDDRFKTIVA